MSLIQNNRFVNLIFMTSKVIGLGFPKYSSYKAFLLNFFLFSIVIMWLKAVIWYMFEYHQKWSEEVALNTFGYSFYHSRRINYLYSSIFFERYFLILCLNYIALGSSFKLKCLYQIFSCFGKKISIILIVLVD